jgi:VWFA-related protein
MSFATTLLCKPLAAPAKAEKESVSCELSYKDGVPANRFSQLIVLFLVAVSGGIASAQQQSTPPVPTLHSTSRLVVLDVVVLDKKGTPVTNLDRSQFSVTEDNAPQQVRNFDAPASHAMPAKAMVHSSVDLANIGAAPVNILVLDQLNTSWETRTYGILQMEHFLKGQPEVLAVPTMLMSIEDGKPVMLKDFTQIRSDLIASVHTVHPSLPAQLQRNGSGNTTIEMFEQTLGTLLQIAESVRGTPGRKNIIWVGTGYPSIDMTQLEFDDRDKIMTLIRRVTNQMMAARVCLYLVDPNGVQTSVHDTGAADGDGGFAATLASTSGPFEGELDFASIVRETGGRVFANRNDVDTVLRESIAQSNNYYTLAYIPNMDRVEDGSYRHARVTVKDASLQVITRDGYFTEKPFIAATPTAGVKSSDELRFDMIGAARTRLIHNGLSVRAKAESDGLHVQVGMSGLHWEPTEDEHQATEVSLMTVFFDRKGKEIRSTAVELKERIDETVNVHGDALLDLKPSVNIPPEASRARFVVRDSESGLIGTADLTL